MRTTTNKERTTVLERVLSGCTEKEISEALTKYYQRAYHLSSDVKFFAPQFITENPAKDIKPSEYNREMKKTNLSNIEKEFETGLGQIKEIPILTYQNEQNELTVLDGHHRYSVCTKTNRPVTFTILRKKISKESEKKFVCKLNYNQLRWSSVDFIGSLANSGNENYKNLQDVVESYRKKFTKMPIISGAAGYYRSSWNGPVLTAVRGGLLSFDQAEKTELINVLESLSPVMDYLKDINFFGKGAVEHKDRYVTTLIALKKYYGDAFDEKHFMNNIQKKFRHHCLINPSVDECISDIAMIVNWKTTPSKKIILKDENGNGFLKDYKEIHDKKRKEFKEAAEKNLLVI